MKDATINWRSVGFALTLVALLGGIVGVWVDTQRDIAALQVEVQRNKEMVIAIKLDVDAKFDKIDAKLVRIEDKIDKINSK